MLVSCLAALDSGAASLDRTSTSRSPRCSERCCRERSRSSPAWRSTRRRTPTSAPPGRRERGDRLACWPMSRAPCCRRCRPRSRAVRAGLCCCCSTCRRRSTSVRPCARPSRRALARALGRSVGDPADAQRALAERVRERAARRGRALDPLLRRDSARGASRSGPSSRRSRRSRSRLSSSAEMQAERAVSRRRTES